VTDFLQDYPEGVIMTIDQMRLYFQATTTRVWAVRGDTPIIRVAAQRASVSFYGALNVRSGKQIALTLPKQSAEVTIQFLDHLQTIYPQRALLILWDRAKWHTAAVVREYLSQHSHIQSLHFPPASPQLNPQEHVWERTRDAISHNHTRTDFAALVQAFQHHLDTTRFHFKWLEKYVPPILLAT
jgi:transposase